MCVPLSSQCSVQVILFFSDVLIRLIPFPLRSGPVVVQHLPVLRLIAFRGFSVTKPDARDSESYAKNKVVFQERLQ